MSTTPYRPRPDSLAGLCIGFFTRNPDEALTLEDITDKFSARRGNIHTILRAAVEACLLTCSKDEDGDYIYTAGADLACWSPTETPASPPPPVPTARTRKTPGLSRAHVDLDLTQLTVDEGIPYVKHSLLGRSKWGPLFEKLTKAGQSIQVPADVKTAVAAAIGKQNALNRGTFKIAITSPTTARLWRIA